MTEEIWNEERLRSISSVMERYSKHLAVGDRVRLGMEGDPCYMYRKAADAPVGTVVDIRRSSEDDAAVDFSLRLDGDTSTLVHLNNRSVHPNSIWEIDPAYMGEFVQNMSVETDDSFDTNNATVQDDPTDADVTTRRNDPADEGVGDDSRDVNVTTKRNDPADDGVGRDSNHEEIETTRDDAYKQDVRVSAKEDDSQRHEIDALTTEIYELRSTSHRQNDQILKLQTELTTLRSELDRLVETSRKQTVQNETVRKELREHSDTVHKEMRRLDNAFQRQLYKHTVCKEEFQKTITEFLGYLCHDLIRVSKGEACVMAGHFAKEYETQSASSHPLRHLFLMPTTTHSPHTPNDFALRFAGVNNNKQTFVYGNRDLKEDTSELTI